jgi:hypothetical protein
MLQSSAILANLKSFVSLLTANMSAMTAGVSKRSSKGITAAMSTSAGLVNRLTRRDIAATTAGMDGETKTPIRSLMDAITAGFVAVLGFVASNLFAPSPNRVIVVAADDRTFIVASQDRTIVVETESRVVVVDASGATVTVQ